MNHDFWLVETAQSFQNETHSARLVTMNDVEIFVLNPAPKTTLIAQNSTRKRFHAKGFPADSSFCQRLEIAFTHAGSAVAPIEGTRHIVTAFVQARRHAQHFKRATRAHAGVCGDVQDFERSFGMRIEISHGHRL